MSNFQIFDRDYLKGMLEPFAPGMSDHLTPIKYEALTPDMFCFLFKTYGRDNQDHYFVLLEYDFMKDLQAATDTIQTWHGKVLEYLPPDNNEMRMVSTLPDLSHTYGPYQCVLAKVEKPTAKGYWSTAFLIMPGDVLNEKLAHLSPKQQKAAKKGLHSIITRRVVNAEESFLENYRAQQEHAHDKLPDTNTSDYAISVYINPAGGVEFFYNRVREQDS